jgi:integrase/recombinase XerD
MEMIPYTRPAPLTLDQTVAGWLHEKHGHSESERTRQAYQSTLQSFRAALRSAQRDLDGDPAVIALAAQGWAALSASPRRESVTPATFNNRLSIVSSFYEYAIRNDVLHYNPIERVKRRVVRSKDAARRLPVSRVKAGLQHIDRTTPEGLRNYALLSVALNTGRRVSELAGLRLKHLWLNEMTCTVTWERCKGNKRMQDELPAKPTKALFTYLYAVYGTALLTLPGDTPVWVSFSKRNHRQAIGTRTISNICEQHLGTSKVHATRHTWALTMHDKGATLQQIGKGLGHSNLKTTSDYLEEQLGYENPFAEQLAEEFGI